MCKYVILSLFCLLVFVIPTRGQAQISATNSQQDSKTYEERAEVTRIIEEQLEPKTEAYQVVEIRILSDGPYKSQTFQIDSRTSLLEGLRYIVRVKDQVQIMLIETENSPPILYITDIVRLTPLSILFFLFIAVTLLVGRWRGLASLVGLAVSLLVLFGFILPRMLAGQNPLAVTLIGSAIILAMAIFGTHGWRKQSIAAFAATVAGLGITGFLATIFTVTIRLTGLASEDASFLQLESGTAINFHGLLLAGIILGAVGVLDDIAVTQSETVFELQETNPGMSRRELISHALHIGRHHIASVVNTLVLAYAGASLPLLMLFYTTGKPPSELFNAEFIAEEIVRTLVGTIGLILTVPIATWFASIYASRKNK